MRINYKVIPRVNNVERTLLTLGHTYMYTMVTEYLVWKLL